MIASLCCVWLGLWCQDPVAASSRPGSPELREPRPLANGVVLRIEAVPDVAARALWVVLPYGAAHDPIDARGLGAALAQALRDSLPSPSAAAPVDVMLTSSATFVGFIVDGAGIDDALAITAALLRGELPLDDARLERARDRAVLRADDESVVLPGPVLRGRAARACVRDATSATACASPAQMRELSVATLRAAFRARVATVGAAVVVLGGPSDAAFDARCSRLLGDVPRRDPFVGELSDSRSFDLGPVPEPEQGHELVEAVFVAAAIAAPARTDVDFWPFAAGLEVLRLRAAETWREFRGAEPRAAFPFVEYDPLLAPRLAFVERRGRHRDDVKKVRSEIRRLLEAFIMRPPTASEIAEASAALRAAFRSPPYDERTRTKLLATNGSALLRSGKVLALRAVSGFATEPEAGLANLDTAAVVLAWSPRLATDVVKWFALTPSR